MSDQQFCLKWNNHRTTLFSVFDNLLEEESLVDVTLSAEGQFIRAHRVILSACSPYFKTLFRASYLNDKHPVIIMKDVDFENLKSLVEYMYKGEVNVSQLMLPSFIRTAESLQIRGLAESANKQAESEQSHQLPQSPVSQPPPALPSQSLSTQSEALKKRNNFGRLVNNSSGGILASHLSQMMDGEGKGPSKGPLLPPPFDMPPDHPFFSSAGLPTFPLPPVKKSRKSEPKPGGSAAMKPQQHLSSTPPPHLRDLPPFLMNRDDRLMMMKPFQPISMTPPKASTPRLPNNNNYDLEEGRLKIVEEDIDPGKENRLNSPSDDVMSKNELSNQEISDEEEEEPCMPEPDLASDPPKIINPWTGEQIKFSEDNEENSAAEDTGIMGWPNMPGDFSETTHSPRPAHSATPTSLPGSIQDSTQNKTVRLKRLNSAQQHTVYTLCQTPEGTKYRCTACSRCFNLKCTLLRHVRHQHQGRFVPHPCGQCGQVFKRTDHLKVHMKKIHNISSVSRQKSNPDKADPAGQSPSMAAAIASLASQQPLPPNSEYNPVSA